MQFSAPADFFHGARGSFLLHCARSDDSAHVCDSEEEGQNSRDEEWSLLTRLPGRHIFS